MTTFYFSVKEKKEEQKQYVLNCLKRLDDENLRINLPECQFTKLEIDRFGYLKSQWVISPIKSKTSAILNLEVAKTPKETPLFSWFSTFHK